MTSVSCTICGTGVSDGYIVHTGPCGNLVELAPPRRPSWGSIWMGLARSLAGRSTCRRMSVGSVVVSADDTRVLAVGYNGNYRGGPNDCDSDEPGACGCIHSEANCVCKLDYGGTARRVLYCTHEPCGPCAKLIINAGIESVVYDREYRTHDGQAVLASAGVDVERYQE